MRFLLATVLFIFSISLLLLGLAQRTIWAPPDNFAVNLNLDPNKPYVLIPSEQLQLLPGEPTVKAFGADEVFMASGNEADLIAWVGQSSHYSIKTSDDTLTVHEVVGLEDYASPKGSDLWQREVSEESIAELSVSNPAGKAVLIASDGIAPAPSSIRVSWPIKVSTVISDVFFGVGFSVLLLAIILNLLALRKMLINRGPRRKLPKAPRGPQYRPRKQSSSLPVKGRRSARRNMIAIPLAIGLTVTLAGCQPAPVEPTPSVSPTESIVDAIPPVVTNAQIKRILRDIGETVALADADTDSALLKKRLAGPALRFREVRYLLMSKSDEIEPPAPIPTSKISIMLPASTNLWPRSVFVVTEGEDELPQALVLQQASPREKYKLWYNVPLLPGSKIPAVPAPETGAIPVEQDSLFLKLAPNQLATAFGDVIDNGSLSPFFSNFNLEGDEFYEQISSSQKAQVEKLKRAKITFTHDLGDPNIIALSTSDSGALVALLMTDNYLIKPTRENAAVTVSGDEELLLGVEGSTEGVRTTYGDMLLFYVPASTADGQITLLGATQTLLAIRAL